MVHSSARRGFAVIVAAAAVVAAAATWAPGSNAQSADRFATPPGNVYTCSWISSHPQAAAAARVTCSAAVFQHELAKAPASSSPKRSLAHALAGCEYMPSSGWIGQGVFAWGSFNSGFSAVIIRHSDGNWPVNYTGYLQNTSGVNLDHGDRFNDDGLGLGASSSGTYRGGVQNHSSQAGQYQTCPEL